MAGRGPYNIVEPNSIVGSSCLVPSSGLLLNACNQVTGIENPALSKSNSWAISYEVGSIVWEAWDLKKQIMNLWFLFFSLTARFCYWARSYDCKPPPRTLLLLLLNTSEPGHSNTVRCKRWQIFDFLDSPVRICHLVLFLMPAQRLISSLGFIWLLLQRVRFCQPTLCQLDCLKRESAFKWVPPPWQGRATSLLH